MPPRTFTGETLRQMALFQSRTGVEPLDCLESEPKIVFVVPEGQIGPAVGKAGKNVNRLRQLLNREVALEDRGDHVHASVSVDPLRKGRAIGKEGRNLRLARELISRHHDVQSVVIA